MIQSQIRALIDNALESLKRSGELAPGASSVYSVDRPARPEHGDFSANAAMVLARTAGSPPRKLAEQIAERIDAPGWVAKVEVAGPGFINFFLTHSWLQDVLVEVATAGDQYGRSGPGDGEKVQVEFVSANPTGPLHVGSGRNAAYGDALARLLEATGHEVSREYYVNDMGTQIDLFAASLEACYMRALGREAEVPENGYRGEYLEELGRELFASHRYGLIEDPAGIRRIGIDRMIASIAATLTRFGVGFDSWFLESSLHEAGKVEEAVAELGRRGHIFEKDGAKWFSSSKFGDSRDRVVVRADGRPTYLTSDIAYLADKAQRGFERAIYVWGADHHGAVASLAAAARALEIDIEFEVMLYQLVNLTSGGEPAKMSKRTGELVSLDELIEEVGADAARFTFLLRSIDTALDFDLDLVKSQTQENPVYYVQYAHARICALVRFGREQGVELQPIHQVALSELMHEAEHALMSKIAEFPEAVQTAARLRAPYRLTNFAQELAALFHAFYRDCRVIDADPERTQARLWLSEATRQVLANLLGILGVSAPESM